MPVPVSLLSVLGLFCPSVYAEPISRVDASGRVLTPVDVGQVTSIDQLSDVEPTDWAFQALQSLLERYGCVAGYPDGTFQGARPTTRSEMVAVLNACLSVLSQRLAAKQELEVTQARLEEVTAMLVSLKGQVDTLEARTTTLESQQFSTTTKLQGEVVMAAQFGDFADSFVFSNNAGNVDVLPTPEVGPGAGAPATPARVLGETRGSAIARVRLSFNTSFNGSDLLSTVLETGNGGLDYATAIGLTGPANPFPVPPTVAERDRPPLVDLGAVDYAGAGPGVSLYRLAYTFKPLKNLAITAGPQIYPSDFIDFNSYANNETQDFSSGFFINNPLIVTNTIDSGGGAGFALDWSINKQFSLRGLYVAANSEIPVGVDNGIGSAPFQASAELEYGTALGAKNNLAVRLQYTRVAAQNSIAVQNVLGINAEATFGQFGIFGRYGISINPRRTNFTGVPNGGLFSSVVGVNPSSNIQTWMAGIGVRDLLVDGSLLAFAAGQPFIVDTSLERYSPQTNFELFYRLPVGDNITITPTVMLITNPFNIEPAAGEPDNSILQMLLRTTFSF